MMGKQATRKRKKAEDEYVRQKRRKESPGKSSSSEERVLSKDAVEETLVKQVTEKEHTKQTTKFSGTPEGHLGVQSGGTVTKKISAASKRTSARGLAFPSNHFRSGGALSRGSLFKTETPVFGNGLARTSAQGSIAARPRENASVRTIPGFRASVGRTDTAGTWPGKTDGSGAARINMAAAYGACSGQRRTSGSTYDGEKAYEAAIEVGNRYLREWAEAKQAFNEKYGALDYAKYVPGYQRDKEYLDDLYEGYRTQREYMEMHYRQIPSTAGLEQSSNAWDQQWYRERLRQIQEEMGNFDSLADGMMDLNSLAGYLRQMNQYQTLLDRPPDTRGEKYMDDSFEQVLKGNYTDKVTTLGTIFQMGLGALGWDAPSDVRDLIYDVTHLESTPAYQTLIDAVSVLPIVGMLKYSDEAAALIKPALRAAEETADAVGDAAKYADTLSEAGKYTDAVEQAVRRGQSLDISDVLDYNTIARAIEDVDLRPAELMDELASSGVKYTPENVVMVTRGPGGLMWLETGNDSAGWKHIFRHAEHFADLGFDVKDVPWTLSRMLKSGPVYEPKLDARGFHAFYMFGGRQFLLAYGTNGYIVSLYPFS